jgi:molecular chaperone GrpE
MHRLKKIVMTKKKNTEEELPVVENQEVETPETKEESLPSDEGLQQKFENLSDAHLRLMAEFDNYRKRTMREKADLLKSAGESILLNMLPLVDDFERGLKVMDEASDIDAVKEGVLLIYDKFTAFLSQQGVKAIDANEQIFDTEFHEAVTTIPAPVEELKGKVIDCIQKGYTLNDKVIRYSKVVVGE